jgi:LysM repeat protein
MAYRRASIGIFLVTIALAAPAISQESGDEPNDVDQEASKEIIASEGAINEVKDTSDAESRYRVALREVLRTGFAYSSGGDPEIAIQTSDQNWAVALRKQALMDDLQVRSSLRSKLQLAGLQFDIPIASHPLVDSYIDYFSGRGRWFFQRWLSRGTRYLPMMESIFESQRLPKDLVYLAMIESGFSSKAYSSAAAAGFWQFIGSTGKRYGLRNDTWVDERRDFVLSTVAAGNYLNALYRQFGDWHLAWAGYNAGSARISRAMKKYGAKDFWDLLNHRDSLAKETQHYVPKLIAAALIGKEPERYGFTDVEKMSPLEYDEIEVSDSVDLQLVAKQFGYGTEIMHDLNPALRHNITPPGRDFTLRVPKGEGEKVAAWLEDLPASERITYSVHKVRRGESLASIARRYKTSVIAICDFNKLPNERGVGAGKQLIIPEGLSKTFYSEPKVKKKTLHARVHKAKKRKIAKHIKTKKGTRVIANASKKLKSDNVSKKKRHKARTKPVKN